MANLPLKQSSDISTSRRLMPRLMVAAAALSLVACGAPAGVSQTQNSLEVAGVPDVSVAMLTLADQLAAEGKYAAALPLYKRARQLDGDNEGAAVGIGNALLKTGHNHEALDAFEAAVADFSDSAAALNGMGRAWMALGRPGVALPAFEAALDRDPGYADALNGKGVALAALGRNREAVRAFEAGLDRNPNDLALKNNLGLALTLSDQGDLGVPLLEEVVQDERATAKNRQSLAMAYGVDGQTENARQMAAIDLDLIKVDDQVASYRTLASLPEEQRGTAVMAALGEEKRNLDKPANRSFLEPVDALATVKRLLAEPEVVAVAEPEPMPEPEPAPEPVEEALDIPPLDDHVGYAVQIAAYRKAEELNPGWEMLKARYGSLIGDLEPRRSEVDFGDRDADPRGFYYRLNAGPLSNFGEAKAICDAIQMEGGDCWVRPPLPEEGRLPDEESNAAPMTVDSSTAAAAQTAETPAPMAPAPVETADLPEEEAPVAESADADTGDVWIAVETDPVPGAEDGAASEETMAEGTMGDETMGEESTFEDTAVVENPYQGDGMPPASEMSPPGFGDTSPPPFEEAGESDFFLSSDDEQF